MRLSSIFQYFHQGNSSKSDVNSINRLYKHIISANQLSAFHTVYI